MTTRRADTRLPEDNEPRMKSREEPRGQVILVNFPIGFGYAYRPKHPARPRRKQRFQQLNFDFTEEKKP